MKPGESSKRLIAPWRATSTDEEARAALQERLIVLSRLMFWSFVVLLVMMVLLYRAHPWLEPARDRDVYKVAGIGLTLLGVIWRLVLVRRQVSLRWLYAVDLFYALTTGLIFAFATYVTPELEVSSTANILWSCFCVFLRALVLPSTGTRTAIAGSATLVPMVVALTARSFVPGHHELPPDAALGSGLMVGAVVVLLASIGSRIIYGLRRQVSAAIRLGQYTLDAKIGEGGNGAVYRAHHAMLRRPTAVKLLRPDRIDAVTLERFEREVQHMSELTHPNTVAVYDYGHSPNGFYYAMEYLDGIDLEKLVGKYGPLPADRVVAIMIQVCGALAEAHRRDLIHRDIKPGNIILCERGDIPDVAKVVDFGLVKELTANDGSDRSGVLGTPAYVAPELVTDPQHAGPAADIYALGAVGYFLLTGRRVFEGKTVVDVCVQHVTKAPVPPSTIAVHVPAALEKVILTCLAKAPADRPDGAKALARLLRELPPARDWSEDEAGAWWSEFRKAAQPSPSSSVLTITVDLADRDNDRPAA